ncbi:P-loop containing nucleoside triphosphate hydrolase protein [Mycena crocata]|nr:P-loop containing nucleoside triphosphate hydrolase protein [Mycena crocata]
MSSDFSAPNPSGIQEFEAGRRVQCFDSSDVEHQGRNVVATRHTTEVEGTAPLNAANLNFDEVLKRVFHLEQFRDPQLEVINATMAGRDTLVLMATGGGKSLCYQLPAVIQNEKTGAVTVVVSPLISLIDEQVYTLKAKGIDTLSFSSGSQTSALQKLDSGVKPALLYVTPERLTKNDSLYDSLRRLYDGDNLARFAVDEVHCISTWGNDFRDKYLQLHTLREDFPGVPIMALTATATPKTVKEVMSQLRLEEPVKFQRSFNRPNLKYVIKHKKNEFNDIVEFIEDGHMSDSGIIYCLSRDSCEKLADKLRKKGIAAKSYHAGMNKSEKELVYNDWKNDACHIIVATIAFGLGIDKADVRFVIHVDLPKSLEGYHQETGRAGRDGLPAICILYYSYRDKRGILDLTPSANESPESQPRRQDALSAVVEYCRERFHCRRVLLLQHLDETFHKVDCGRLCDNCENEGMLRLLNISKEAKSAVVMVQSFQPNVTVKQSIEIFRGSRNAFVRGNGHDRNAFHGAGADISYDMELLFDELLYHNILVEVKIETNREHRRYSHYLKVSVLP